MPYFPKLPVLNLGQQLAGLKATYPSGAGNISQRVLRWSTELTPTPLSRAYCVEIELRQCNRPKVFVRTPCLLDLANGRKIPHLYCQNPAELCLYYPEFKQWTHSHSLARTVIPWSSLWLYYFEDWMIDGEWKGGGIHPKIS